LVKNLAKLGVKGVFRVIPTQSNTDTYSNRHKKGKKYLLKPTLYTYSNRHFFEAKRGVY